MKNGGFFSRLFLFFCQPFSLLLFHANEGRAPKVATRPFMADLGAALKIQSNFFSLFSERKFQSIFQQHRVPASIESCIG